MTTRTQRTTRVATAAATLVATAFVVVGPTSSASAAPTTYVVDTLSDNPANGFTLREAINDANNNAGDDRIEFADGLNGTITLESGQLESTDDLSIVGPGVDNLTIDGNGASRVLESSAAGASLFLNNLTIANGATLGSGGGVAYSSGDDIFVWSVKFVGNEAGNQGGGLWIVNPVDELVDLTGVQFDSNRSGNSGGGLYLNDAAGTGALQLTANTHVNNVSVNGKGAGMFVSTPLRSVSAVVMEVNNNEATNGDGGGAWINGADVLFLAADFTENIAGGNFGGAMISATSTGVSLQNSTFDKNSASEASAGRVSAAGNLRLIDVVVANHQSSGTGGFQASASGDIAIERSTFTNNSGGTVGAMRASSAATLSVKESTFSDNFGDGIGGLAASGIGSTSIEFSTFTNNDSQEAGGSGGAVRVPGGSILVVSNSTFVGNDSDDGGAINASGGSVTLQHATIVDNTAGGEGGGVYVGPGGNIEMTNSIVADNTALSFPDVNDTTLNIDHSILGDSAGIVMGGGGNQIGADPKLGLLADNGGRTETMMPELDSPAIDAGDSNPMMINSPDQRGRFRTTTTPDIGSVEVFDDDGQVWIPTEPARFVDTRSNGETIDDENEATGAFTAGEQRRISFADRGDVPSDAVGVIANITAVNPEGNGFMTAHPCVDPRPNIASLNHTAGVNLGDEIILGLTGGDACIFTSANTHITVDVVAYIAPESRYKAIEPARYADTRASGVTFDGLFQAGGAPGADKEMSVNVKRGDVSLSASSVVMYVAAVNPDENGFVTVWACGDGRPLSSSLNHVAGVNRGNEIIAEIGDEGNICFYTSADVDLTVDVVGYVRTETNYESLDSPSRFLDTRANGETVDGESEADGAIGAGETIELPVRGRADISDIATTVSVNVTAVNPSAPGFVTVYDCNDLPLASSLNYVPEVNGGNEVIASLNSSGNICLYSSAATHLTADVTGYTSL